jgi:hypothetical protein
VVVPQTIRTLDEKLHALFEAARRSLYVAELTAKRLYFELAQLEPDIDNQRDIGERAIIPLITAVGFVDFSHRYGSIMDALPRISKKAAEMKALSSVLKPVEHARNHLQHMRNDLSSNERLDYPILGSLSWIGSGACYSMIAAQPYSSEITTIAYNLEGRFWATACKYTVKRSDIYVPETLNQMKITYDWLTSLMEFSDPSELELKWGRTESFRMHPPEISQQ